MSDPQASSQVVCILDVPMPAASRRRWPGQGGQDENKRFGVSNYRRPDQRLSNEPTGMAGCAPAMVVPEKAVRMSLSGFFAGWASAERTRDGARAFATSFGSAVVTRRGLAASSVLVPRSATGVILAGRAAICFGAGSGVRTEASAVGCSLCSGRACAGCA